MLTLRLLWETLYRPYILPQSADQTLSSIECSVNAWDRWGWPSLDLRAARASHWTSFAANMIDSGRSPATVNHYLREHRAILRFAYSEGLVDRLPTIRPLPEPERIRWRPTIEQVGRLYSSVPIASVTWPLGPPGYAVDWWQTFIVIAYVGAFRVSEIRAIRIADCQDDGIVVRSRKTGRISFCPGLPCVQRQVQRMRRWASAGTCYLMSCGHGHRQFDRARDAIGEAAGIRWRPHDLRRASIDAWFNVSETAGTIVGHGRRSTACRHYLDRRAYLLSVADRLAIPAELAADKRQLTLF